MKRLNDDVKYTHVIGTLLEFRLAHADRTQSFVTCMCSSL